MSYTVIITEEVAANIAVTTQNYPITIEYNATNISDGSTYGNANVAGFMASFGSNVISTTGNVTAGNIIANGQYLTNLTAGNIVGVVAQAAQANTANTATSAGTANVALVANSVAGANVTGVVAQATQAATANIALVANSVAGANVTGVVAQATQAATANVANSVAGANVTGVVAQATQANAANTATTAGSATTAATVTSNAQANITSVGTLTSLSVSGNITGGNVLAPNFLATNSAGGTLKNSGGTTQASWGAGGGDNFAISVSTNINGANAQVAISPTGSGHVHIKPTGTGAIEIAPTNPGSINNMVIGNVTPAAVSATTVSASGNVTGANLNATTNTTTGNIAISLANNNIKSINAVDLNTAPSPQRITLGSGYNGNYSANVDPLVISRGGTFAVIDKYNIGNADTNMAQRMSTSTLYADMGGNTLTNNGRRLQPLQGVLFIGNGTQQISAGPVFATATGLGGAVGVGNITLSGSTVDMGGTTTVSHVAGAQASITVGGNANVGNAAGYIAQIQTFTATSSNTTSAFGFAPTFAGSITSNVAPTNVYGFYMPGTTATHGISNVNNWRRATNYYFLMNEDDVAQNRLGSLRRYHEFESATATSGSFAIDKNTAQVHNIVPTGNCTITGYSNMVVSASDGTNTDAQVDTLTIIVEQGATPYTITLPTGAAFKYAGNVRTVGTTANSVTMISVTAANVGGTTTYLTTVSPEFV